MIFYLSEGLTRETINLRNAGSKARIDVEEILSQRYSKFATVKSIKKKSGFFEKVIFILRPESIKFIYNMIFQGRKGVFIVQYPWWPFNWMYHRLIRRFALKYPTVLLIHDVNSLRSAIPEEIDEEVKFLNHMKAVIVHNPSMKSALVKYGLKVPCVILYLFDYLLYNGIPNKPRNLGNRVVFAGNLKKSLFLGDLPQGENEVHFNLYGIGFNTNWKENTNMSYCGSYPAEEIPYQLEGSFGLVWDGESAYTCDTDLAGKYTRVNNPHKLSLYVAAGIPVIVWEHAAIAEFVKKEKIGFTVNSLFDISKIIRKMDDAEYNGFVQNVRKLQEKVIHGYYTNEALDKVEKILMTK